MFRATLEQQAILDAGLAPLKVIACPGSGKTATAVRRLVEVRKRMGPSKGYAVLLSYSNVAVDTFRTEYAKVAAGHPGLSSRVLICTVDSFTASHILGPHGAKVMNCSCRPFLAHGRERFLENPAFSVFDGKRPIPIRDVDLRNVGSGLWDFINRETKAVLPDEASFKAMVALGRAGAYTHALGRLWTILTLEKVERLAEILARKFPHILVDEAQDIGSLHGFALTQLQQAGSILSLIGDPNQAIFEFADADGSFLRNFEIPPHGLAQPLSENRRSIQSIVTVANNLTKGASHTNRLPHVKAHGAYYLRYDPENLAELIASFSSYLLVNGYAPAEAAILARGSTLAYGLAGGQTGVGQGATKLFAEAAAYRDVRREAGKGFERALDGMLRLLVVPDNGLRGRVTTGDRDSVASGLRRCVWRFLRDRETGIPDSSLAGDAWLGLLKARLPAALTHIQMTCGLEARARWGANVTAAKVGSAPISRRRLLASEGPDIRILTVHKAKGESIPAVLYVTNAKSLNSLLSGPDNEEGRIGYVAITRAADLLILAIPKATKSAQISRAQSLGFTAWMPLLRAK